MASITGTAANIPTCVAKVGLEGKACYLGMTWRPLLPFGMWDPTDWEGVLNNHWGFPQFQSCLQYPSVLCSGDTVTSHLGLESTLSKVGLSPLR